MILNWFWCYMHSYSTLCKPCLVWYNWMIIAFVFFKTRVTKKKREGQKWDLFFNSKYFYNKRSLNIFFYRWQTMDPEIQNRASFQERERKKKIIISFIIFTPIKYESSAPYFSPSQLQPDSQGSDLNAVGQKTILTRTSFLDCDNNVDPKQTSTCLLQLVKEKRRRKSK